MMGGLDFIRLPEFVTMTGFREFQSGKYDFPEEIGIEVIESKQLSLLVQG